MMDLKIGYQYFLLHLADMRRSRHTIKQYRVDGKGLLTHLNEQAIISTQDDVATGCLLYREHLIQSSYSPRSIARKVSSLKSYLRYMHRSGWLQDDISVQIENVQKQDSVVRFLTSKEIDQLRSFYQAMQHELTGEDIDKYYWMYGRNHAMIQVLIGTGITPQELINIKVGHVEDGKLFIAGPELSFREITIEEGLNLLLKSFMKETEERLSKDLTASDFLWFGSKHSNSRSLNIKAVERIVSRALEAIGSDKTAINIRHTAIASDPNDLSHETYGYTRKSTLTELLQANKKKKPSVNS